MDNPGDLLQWGGWAAFLAMVGKVIGDWLQHRTAQAQGSTQLLDVALKHYRELTTLLRQEMDEQRTAHAAEMSDLRARHLLETVALTERVTAIESRERECREQLREMKRDIEALHVENSQLRHGRDG